MRTTAAAERWAPAAPRAAAAAVVVGALGAELVLAAAVVQPRLAPLLGLAAALAAILAVFRWPLLGAVAFLLLVASFIGPQRFSVGVGPIDLRGYELALGALLAVALLRPRVDTWGGTPGVLLAAALGVLGLATLLAVSAGRATVSDAWQWGRPFGVLTLFWVVVRLFGDRPSARRLLGASVAVGALTGLAAAAVSAGADLTVLFGSATEQFVNRAGVEDAGVSRIRLPGVALAYALLWFAVLRLLSARGARRAAWGLGVAGLVVNLGLSFNRNMWVGAALGLVALLALGGAGWRRPFVLAALATAAVGASVGLLNVEIDRNSGVAPIVERGRSLLDPRQVARESSLRDRGAETERAWATLRANPLFGVGPGAPFGAYVASVDQGSLRVEPQLFLHNQYLFLGVVGGVPLLATFVAFLLATLAAGGARRRSLTELALATGVGMVMLSAFVMIAFADSNMAAALALVAGALVVHRRTASSPLGG